MSDLRDSLIFQRVNHCALPPPPPVFLGMSTREAPTYGEFEPLDPFSLHWLLDALSCVDERRPANAVRWISALVTGDRKALEEALGGKEDPSALRSSPVDYLEETGVTRALVDALKGRGPLVDALHHLQTTKPLQMEMHDRPEPVSFPQVRSGRQRVHHPVVVLISVSVIRCDARCRSATSPNPCAG